MALVEYDPSWPDRYAALAAEVRAALGDAESTWHDRRPPRPANRAAATASDPPLADNELDLGEQGCAGELSGEVAGIEDQLR
jgi:hypothetical protein